jgi:hypothetical protein
MEVNTSFSAGGVGGITPRKLTAPTVQTTAAPDSFASSNALERAVRSLPASRPDAVARAAELVADPTYPSAGLLRQVSQLLAERLTPEDE